MNNEYDATYKFGNTTCYVVAPKISHEQNLYEMKKVEYGFNQICKNNGYSMHKLTWSKDYEKR